MNNCWMAVLTCTSKGEPLRREHFFKSKAKSVCGKVNYPKIQLNKQAQKDERCEKCLKLMGDQA